MSTTVSTAVASPALTCRAKWRITTKTIWARSAIRTSEAANNTNDYYPYGSTRIDGGITTAYKFTGQRQAPADTGLYYFQARFYDPYLNRWIQPDPIIPNPGNPQDLNRYAYCRNNPLRYVDPSGHDPLDQAWQDEWHQNHPDREITAEDMLIRLFSIAFPKEWDSSKFYNVDGSYISGSLNKVFQDNSGRSWADVPGALEHLAGWYKDGEEGMFTRDVGSLFGGLLNRFEQPDAWATVSDRRNPVRVWVYVGPDGLDPVLSGASYAEHDRDYNIHHWGWALTMGGEEGALTAGAVNTGREVTQFNGNWNATASDVWLGNRGALLGQHFTTVGIRDVTQAWGKYMVRH